MTANTFPACHAVALVCINLVLTAAITIARPTFTVVYICFALVANEACRAVTRERGHTKLMATGPAVETRPRLALVIILFAIVALKAIRASTNIRVYVVDTIVEDEPNAWVAYAFINVDFAVQSLKPPRTAAPITVNWDLRIGRRFGTFSVIVTRIAVAFD